MSTITHCSRSRFWGCLDRSNDTFFTTTITSQICFGHWTLVVSKALILMHFKVDKSSKMQQSKTTIEISRVQKREGNHCTNQSMLQRSLSLLDLGFTAHIAHGGYLCVFLILLTKISMSTSQWLQPWQLNKTLCRCARNTLPSPKVPLRPDRNLRSSTDSQGFQRNISNLFQASQHRNIEESSNTRNKRQLSKHQKNFCELAN